jgi:hypothetical protein
MKSYEISELTINTDGRIDRFNQNSYSFGRVDSEEIYCGSTINNCIDKTAEKGTVKCG